MNYKFSLTPRLISLAIFSAIALMVLLFALFVAIVQISLASGALLGAVAPGRAPSTPPGASLPPTQTPPSR